MFVSDSVSGKGKTITLTEVEATASSLNLAEVFLLGKESTTHFPCNTWLKLCSRHFVLTLLDTGPIVYQWDGSTAGTFLKNKANWYLKMLRDERQGKFETVIMGKKNLQIVLFLFLFLDWNDDNPTFYELLGGKPDSFAETNETPGWVPVLYR